MTYWTVHSIAEITIRSFGMTSWTVHSIAEIKIHSFGMTSWTVHSIAEIKTPYFCHDLLDSAFYSRNEDTFFRHGLMVSSEIKDSSCFPMT